MLTKLVANLSEQDKRDFEVSFAQSIKTRERIIEVLKKDVEALITNMASEEHYLSPNWPYIQADRIAQIKAYKSFISLLS